MALVIAAAAGAGAALPAASASADTYNDVSVTIPASIVLDGTPVAVTVTNPRLTGYSDKVTLVLYNGTSLQTYDTIAPNKQVMITDTRGIQPGALVGRASSATTYCSWTYDDYCSLDDDFNWYKFVTGLTYNDSAPAVAKYGSKVSLVGVNDGAHTVWTATAQHYAGYSWQPWAGAVVTIGATPVTTDDKGVATWIEQTTSLQPRTATATETSDVWSSASAAVTPVLKLAPVKTTPPAAPKPVAAKPGHVKTSASASTAASALKKGIPSVRKVVKLTKKNDVNKLLGKTNGYTSAAVLYDTRTSCSDGAGVDCGATIEKFTTIAKAKARAKHIQKLLKQYHLGTEYDTVHGHFLLRVSGDLTRSQAAKYKSAWAKVFK